MVQSGGGWLKNAIDVVKEPLISAGYWCGDEQIVAPRMTIYSGKRLLHGGQLSTQSCKDLLLLALESELCRFEMRNAIVDVA